MALLTDDPRYTTALQAYLAREAQLYADYRQRLASAVTARVATALAEMGDAWDEEALRRALADWDRVLVDVSLGYIEAALLMAGEVESAKRLDELREHVDLDDLPPVLARAVQEMDAAGAFAMFEEQPPPADEVEDASEEAQA